jgi:adenylate cyclase
MNESPPPVGKICCVFTDIIDSTNMWAYNQRAMQTALTIHDAIIRAELAHFDGYEVKALGDGFLASFSTAESALGFCLSAQKKLRSVPWPKEILDYALQREYWSGHCNYQPRGIRVRMGIHFGAPFACSPNQLTGRMDYYGYMVNIAARIHREAEGDEIALSDDFIVELCRHRTGHGISASCLTHQLRAQITSVEFDEEEFRVRSKGLRVLKGVHNPQHVFLIVLRM